MKKNISFLIFFLLFSLEANAGCLCSSEIDNIFDQIETHVVDDNVDVTTDNIEDVNKISPKFSRRIFI